ncbi:MAG TPA: thiazole synthase [Polyangiaceae bacterium LLY-WYZ-15_(1-7)]|nr:thiazole synthase [Myxococcales bacterium]MAT30039.1 thiazole synthase [Sandaracinus sp.]HJL01439.1 thiazole synthase [Polyangiaceae bacterium LLY-WYZ-15_(1-7)]MBJ72332.1 thiazole synthase [Sandaracinus sp.]HJL08542.1 thiazole synthase [Polyangiaceae bacterium LLY-WYZ-15_(1-7)]
MSDDALKIGEFSFSSRLFTGTGKYPDVETARAALKASGCEVVTVAVRRVDLKARGEGSILGVLQEGGYTILPNTAGCYTAKDAVRTARLAREMLDTPLVKLEVIGDEKTLFPDVPATLEAAELLVKDGFTVLPYVTDDPVACRRLEDLGCAAVMPLAAPIGSGLGVRNPFNVEIIVKHAGVPVIVDAGVGTASDAAFAMELGVDAILMNTAIAGAKDPVRMARAMKAAVEAGRDAFFSGRIPKKLFATASSPLEGVIGSTQ